MPKRSGRKSVAQTPAPKSDKIYGSKKNPKGSASSEKTAKSIKLSEQTEKVLKNKLSEFKEEHPNKKSVTLSDLKAVYRRGSGAYSNSHRPFITGGAPNSRAAWSYARVNKFLKKAGGAKVKAAYVQDDDLFAKGGEVVDIKTKINQYLNGAEIEFNSKEGEYVGNAKISYGRIDKLNSLFDIMARGTDDMGYIAFVDDLKKHGLKPSNKVNFIELIWIEKEFRGKGYASAGLDDIIEAYKEDGAGHLMLSVGQEGGLENKDLIKFYKRHGFVPLEGSIENSVRKYNPTMILDLKQNKLAKGGELPGLVAPNGKPSNLTPEQYKLVRTPKFKAWFGDWENDPQNASKIVDENGEPLAVYHGAEIFNKAELGRFNIFKKGSYFTDTYKSAKYYAFKLAYGITDVKESDTEIYNVFLNIRNPKTFDYEKDEAEDYFWDFDQNDKRIDKYISEGYDGILWEHKSKMYDTSIKELEKHFINFSPNQIKIADGTNTTFDIDNQDIRYEYGGSINQEVKCVNCGWKWETADSDKEDMYICHQCGFDNTLYYTDIMSKLKKPMSVSEISQEHGVSTEYIDNQLDVGIKHELEHTDDEGIARIIALHHIGEKPNYYELLEKYKLEDGGQPSKFWHQADQYEIADFIQNERMATEELLCSGDTRISKAIICRAKIDIAEQKEQRAHNLEEKNAWSAVKNIWEECLKDIKNGVVYEYKDGGECGCMSYKDGGLAYGNSHDKGGMPLKVESTGQNIEIEGGEGVINKRSMQMSKKLDFQGKKMTPCQIVSKINEMGGGVKFKCQDVAEILAEDGNF